MKLFIPELSLVLLVGPSGCGKSTFARKHFRPSEVVSSDFYRSVVCDDEGNQAASRDAFELLHQVVARRLAWKRFTVVDATNLQADARKSLLELARKYHYLTAALVFDLPEEQCQQHNRVRSDRTVPPRVITTHAQILRRALAALPKEGFTRLYFFRSTQEIESAIVQRTRMWSDRRDELGPFDVIGDVHGCFDELAELLTRLGYRVGYQTDAGGTVLPVAVPPPGRKAVFVGDLADRGPDAVSVYRLVMGMARAGSALCVLGNHDQKLLRKLKGNDVKLSHGLAGTVEQMEREPAWFREQVRAFLDGLESHYVLDGGKLVVAHAGLREDLYGRASGTVRNFALYGDTTGEKDEFGLPVRLDWAANYRGQALVLYGHTPVAEPAWRNNTMNIDTGCCFGGRLSALRYPEREVLSARARRQYAEPGRPFLTTADLATLSPQQAADDVLDLADVSGKRVIATRLLGTITIPAENSSAALEAMSRFAVNPRWLVYLPPTMSPSETSKQPGLLEHPAEAFAYYRNQGVGRVVCQEKHMGSRAVVILCRDEATARRVFGVEGEGAGIVYTRMGRRFFETGTLEAELLERLRSALDQSGLWAELGTDWVCLDAELMPWSAKAQQLLRTQYAAVGAAGQAALTEVTALLEPVASASPELAELARRHTDRGEAVSQFVEAYRRYCWPVRSVGDLKLAPFHLLASAGAAHTDKPHAWHMEQLRRLAGADGEVLIATAALEVDVNDPGSVEKGTAWWEQLTVRGGEGMVVKPADFVTRGPKGLVQPAVKCRGPEYLRIIYGPEYLAVGNLDRLRQRGLSAKRGLALREFSLGVEALERFIRKEPLRRVHECCFGVLALESEPVDPRL